MTKEEIKAKMEEREEFIVDILKEDPKNGVSGKSIEDACGITASNRAVYMRKLMKKYPQIQNVGLKEAEYKWIEDEKPVPKKNPEGYPDPTPKKAIENTSIPTIKPGEVWSAMETNGASQPIFILNSLNGAAQCIKLYHETSENIKIVGPDHFQIQIYGINYVGDPSHVTPKPLRYLVKRIAVTNKEKLYEARWFLSRVFGIGKDECEAKEDKEKEELKKLVEQLREDLMGYMMKEAQAATKKPEVKIPDDYVDCKTAELAIVTEQRDIWKEVALKLLDSQKN